MMFIISEHCATTLQAAVLAACAEVMRYLQQPELSSSDVQDFRKPVLDIVYSALQTHARQQTALRCAAVRLPDELLVDTFAHLDVYDRIRTATVCHRWRSVSLNAPGRLWTTVPALANLAGWTALLDRACNLPVTLERIYINKRTFYYVSSILGQHMDHIKSLELVQPSTRLDEEEDHEWKTELNGLLELPAPELEHIFVDHDECCHQPLPILAAPKLRSVVLYRFYLSCLAPCAALSTLRSLVIDVPQDGEFPVKDWTILSSFPALEVLAVRLGRFFYLQGAPQLSITLPHTLKRFHLDTDHDIFRLLVKSLIGSVGRVPHWKMCFSRTFPIFREVLRLCHGYFVSVVLSWSQCISFMVTKRTGEQRILQSVQPDVNWFKMLSNVERLCLNTQTQWLLVHASLIDHSLTCVALQELTLDVSVVDPGMAIATNALALDWPYGACPVLHTVRVRAHCYPIRVQLPSVVAVLSLLVDSIPGRRLSLLELDNVDLISNAGADALSLLRTFAETVIMRTDGDSWPECHVMWNQRWHVLPE